MLIELLLDATSRAVRLALGLGEEGVRLNRSAVNQVLCSYMKAWTNRTNETKKNQQTQVAQDLILGNKGGSEKLYLHVLRKGFGSETRIKGKL